MPLWRRSLQLLMRQVQGSEHALVKLTAYALCCGKISSVVNESMQLRLQLPAGTNDFCVAFLFALTGTLRVPGSERRRHFASFSAYPIGARRL